MKRISKPMSRRKQLLWGTVAAVMLILFLLLGAARVSPRFYRQWKSVPDEKKVELSKTMIRKSLDLYSHFEAKREPWSFYVTDQEINAWLSVEAKKRAPELDSRLLHAPRLAFQQNRVEFAFQMEYGLFQGTFHFEFSVSLRQPNQLVVQFRSAKVGLYPLSREMIVDIIEEQLRSRGIIFRRINESGDIALLIDLDMKIQNEKRIIIDSLKTESGKLLIEGDIKKITKPK